MRNITFRGKHVFDGTWIYGGLLYAGDNDCFIVESIMFHDSKSMSCDTFKSSRVAPETIGQSTGLTDKKGREIFEGDLVQTTHSVRLGTSVHGSGRNQNTYSVDKTITESGVVTYENGKWLVKFDSFEDYDSYFFCNSRKDRPKHVHQQVVEELPRRIEHFEICGNIYEGSEKEIKEVTVANAK